MLAVESQIKDLFIAGYAISNLVENPLDTLTQGRLDTNYAAEQLYAEEHQRDVAQDIDDILASVPEETNPLARYEQIAQLIKDKKIVLKIIEQELLRGSPAFREARVSSVKAAQIEQFANKHFSLYLDTIQTRIGGLLTGKLMDVVPGEGIDAETVFIPEQAIDHPVPQVLTGSISTFSVYTGSMELRTLQPKEEHYSIYLFDETENASSESPRLLVDFRNVQQHTVIK